MDPQDLDHQLSFWHYLQQLQNTYSSGQSYHASATQLNWLHHQRLLQLEQLNQQQQQQQQQQLLMAMSQQLYQRQQQFQHQNMPMAMPMVSSPMKPVYEPGSCAKRLIHYIHDQSLKPQDNNIEFWRGFVDEYFDPNAIKKLCFSMHENGKKVICVSPLWNCEICSHKPGHGFETVFEALPRLFKVKYDGGLCEELLHVGEHREYLNSFGQIVLECAKTTTESVYEKFRVLHSGSLRIVFSPNMKICSWEFCVLRHEVFMIRRSLIPMVNELGAVVQNCKALAETETANISTAELQTNCNMMVASTKQLAETLEVPLDDNLGYIKSYVRYLQMSQVANSMKDLIDYSREKGIGPIESLKKFPKRKQQQQQQKMGSHDSNGDQNIELAASTTSSTG